MRRVGVYDLLGSHRTSRSVCSRDVSDPFDIEHGIGDFIENRSEDAQLE